MRLKSFYGATSSEAMRLVREALGDDAIIVATRDDEMGGVRVTAAIEDTSPTPRNTHLMKKAEDCGSESIETIASAFVSHAIPSAVAERLLATATQYASEDPLLSLGAALDTHFKFEPLPDDLASRVIILIGPPGAGKTLCAAKIATKVAMAQKPVALISTDTERAGGMAQLSAFATLLKTELVEIEDAPALADAVAIQKPGTCIIIDTAGCNPYDEAQKQNLATLIRVSGAMPIIVLPADLDSDVALDMAKAFHLLGAKHLMPTRLDMTKRVGTLLRIAFEARLSLCNFSDTSKVTQPPLPLNPVSLGRMILPTKQEPQQKATGTS